MVFLNIVSAPGPGWSTFGQCQSKCHIGPCQGKGQGQELDNSVSAHVGEWGEFEKFP